MSMSDDVYDPRPIFYRTGACLWLLGFVFALMPLAAYEAESFMLAVFFAVFSALCVLATAPFEHLKNAFRSPVVGLALGFWGLALASVALSEVSFVSFIYFCFFSVFPLGFFAFVFQGSNRAFTSVMAIGLACMFAFLGLSCLVQYFFLTEMLFSGYVNWPLANPNSLAGLLSLGVFGGFGWMLVAKDRMQSNMALALSVVLMAAIFTTGSRGALFALLPVLSMFMFFARKHISKHKKCSCMFLSLSVAAFVLISVFAPAESATPFAAMGTTFATELALLAARPAIWESTLQILQSNLWTGTGIGTFFLYYPEVRSIGDPDTAGLMVHADPLQFAVEIGVFAPLIFYALIGLAIVRTVRALKKLEMGDAQRVFVLAPFCAFGALVLHAHITFHFHVLSILMVAGPLMGFWFVETGKALEQSYDHTPQQPYEKVRLRWLLAFPLLTLLGVFATAQASEILVNRAQIAVGQGNMNTFAEGINRAGSLSHNNNARALVAATSVPLGILQLNAPLLPKDEVAALYAQVESLLDRAEAANPRLVQIPYHRGELHSFAYAFLPEELKEGGNVAYYLKAALALDPLHLSSRIMLANLTARAGQKREALDILEAGLTWRYKTQNPRFFLEKTIRFAQELGDEKILQKAQDEFKIYFPNQDGLDDREPQ